MQGGIRERAERGRGGWVCVRRNKRDGDQLKRYSDLLFEAEEVLEGAAQLLGGRMMMLALVLHVVDSVQQRHCYLLLFSMFSFLHAAVNRLPP